MHDQHLKTRFVIEVRVTGRNNQAMKKMLKIRELLAYAMLMVIVYKRNCSDYRRIWRGRCSPTRRSRMRSRNASERFA